jgi:hypothetical protein
VRELDRSERVRERDRREGDRGENVKRIREGEMCDMERFGKGGDLKDDKEGEL